MLKLLLASHLLLFSSCVGAPSIREQAAPSEAPLLAIEAAEYLSAALDSIVRYSIRRDSLDWEQLRLHALSSARGAHAPEETYDAIREVLQALGDRHSFFATPEQFDAWSRRGLTENPPPQVYRLDQSLGYVLLPSYEGGLQTEINLYAARLQRSIARVDQEEVCGWVLDLRENSGGNMWPMLAGIGPLLGEGPAGAFVGPDGRATPWSYSSGAARIWANDLATAGDSTYLPNLPWRPVAVLTSSRTGSSGEAIVVAFQGRPHTRTIGQSTYGVSTSNRMITLSDGARIFLTASVFSDRTGRRYGGPIEPDTLISWDASGTGSGVDPVLAAATDWLLQQDSCLGSAHSAM